MVGGGTDGTGATGTAGAHRDAAVRAWAALRPRLTADAVAALGEADADAFLTRADLALPDVHGPLAALYGDRADALFERALRTALAAAAERPGPLRRRDRRREIDPAMPGQPGRGRRVETAGHRGR